MLVCWDKWIVNQASDVPSIIMFFMISCKIRCRNGFNLFFCFFHEFTKIEIKSYVCSKSIRNLKKKMLGTSDAWSMVHLSQQTSVSYSRLTDLKLVQSRKVFSLWSHFKKKICNKTVPERFIWHFWSSNKAKTLFKLRYRPNME